MMAKKAANKHISKRARGGVRKRERERKAKRKTGATQSAFSRNELRFGN